MHNLKLIFAICFVFFSGFASAAYTCSGKVVGLSINPIDGSILAEEVAGIAWPVLCSISTPKNGVTVESCNGVYSMLMSAQITGTSVTLWFNDDAQGGSCSSHPGWAHLTGWYFGPKLKS